jgi:C1A family cysteine protease
MSTIAVISASFLITVVVLWWISGGGKNADPPNWRPAQAYQISFVMTLENGLEEPGVAMVDQKQNKMRVSYYSGMTTYILNPHGPSWSIVPRIDRLTCFEETSGIELQAIFPDMRLFKYVRQRDITIKPRGAKAAEYHRNDEGDKKSKKKSRVTCEEWLYRAPSETAGYMGTYTLWTLSGSNNVPVRFSFIGHNIILGSSHYDNYTIDYYDYYDLTSEGGVDPFWLKPPQGMPCINITDDSSGPTLASQHVRKWKMMFPEHEQDRQEEYERFYKTTSKKEKSLARAAVFHQSLRLVEAHNRDMSKSYQLGINFMADWTADERRAFARSGLKATLKLADKTPKSNCKIEKLSDLLVEYTTTKLPDIVDHIGDGLTLPPGEQGTCGSCWAFATTGAVEGQIAKITKKPPVALSEQNLMDCSWLDPYDNFACNGGLDYTAYAWAMQHNNGTIATELSYPFLNQDGFCHYDLKRRLVAEGAHVEKGTPRIVECFHVTEAFMNSSTLSVDDLMKAFNLRLNSEGPLAISIDATPMDFYLYTGGVYNNVECKSDSESLDHAVLAVGYNFTDAIPYTKIRNNWGVWGEQGYARIAQKGNICGVFTAPTYVHVDD